MIGLNRIKPKHLELVIKIAETEQLQLAAQGVGISQPAASRILHDLEKEFATRLFDRHPAGMEPTAAGQIFIRHARGALTELSTMAEELEFMNSGQMGAVSVGAVTGPAVGHLMPAVHAVQTSSPDVRISVDVAPSSVLYRGLEEARYDFVLGRADPTRDTRGFHFHPGRKERVLLMVHAKHPLAHKRNVSLSELTDHTWVIQQAGSPIRLAVEEAFHTEGLAVPSKVLNSSSLLVAFSGIENGHTIAPQTEEVVRLFTSEKMGTNVTVLDTTAKIEVAPYFVIRDNRRELTRAAETLLTEVLARF